MRPAIHALSSTAFGINCAHSLSAVEQQSCFQMCKAFLGHCGSLPVERFLSVYTMHPGRQPRMRLMLKIWDILSYQQLRYTSQWRRQLPRECSFSPELRLWWSSTKQTDDKKEMEFWVARSNPLLWDVYFMGGIFFPMIFFSFLTLIGSFGLSFFPHPEALIMTQFCS